MEYYWVFIAVSMPELRLPPGVSVRSNCGDAAMAGCRAAGTGRLAGPAQASVHTGTLLSAAAHVRTLTPHES